MVFKLLMIAAASLLFAILFVIAQTAHLAWIIDWSHKQTERLGYFGKSADERERFRGRLRFHRRLLFPVVSLLAKTSRFRFEQGSFRFREICGPRGTCNEESFQAAADYVPQSEDVFVVSQMKSGTTWLQQLVIQVLSRGENSPIDDGATLYSVSPWIESTKSVSVEAAPMVADHRVIKTHLPVTSYPDSDKARYIYVARHPVSCFASCVDFVAANLGAMAPDLAEFERWFTDENLMWWGTWPTHVAGWWTRAQQKDNVLFVSFEEMRADLGAVAQSIASFLNLPPLSEAELEPIVAKCSFEFMKANSTLFEMHPPHVLQADGKFFVSGKSNRFLDIPEEARERIFVQCRSVAIEEGFPFDSYYGGAPEACSTVSAVSTTLIPEPAIQPG